jgi:hypothetical protein
MKMGSQQLASSRVSVPLAARTRKHVQTVAIDADLEVTEINCAIVCNPTAPGTRVEYPFYHTSDDLLEHLSSEQIYLLAKATMASSIVYADPVE